jgi:hypothetical protein
MFMNRRDAVASLALLAQSLAVGQSAAGQTQTASAGGSTSPRPPVFQHDLPNVMLDD